MESSSEMTWQCGRFIKQRKWRRHATHCLCGGQWQRGQQGEHRCGEWPVQQGQVHQGQWWCRGQWRRGHQWGFRQSHSWEGSGNPCWPIIGLSVEQLAKVRRYSVGAALFTMISNLPSPLSIISIVSKLEKLGLPTTCGKSALLVIWLAWKLKGDHRSESWQIHYQCW